MRRSVLALSLAACHAATPPRPESSVVDACEAGSLSDVIACRRASCETRVQDVTPVALAPLGWRLLQCDEPADTGMMSNGMGAVWLYRGAPERVALAEALAGLGASAKYYNDAKLTVMGASRRRTPSGRPLLWLEWRLDENIGGGALEGAIATSTTTVTLCREDLAAPTACVLDVVESREQRFTPWLPSGPKAWTFSERFDVKLVGDGVDVSLRDVRGDRTRLDASQIGHHAL